MNLIEIIIYATDTGKEPFSEWEDQLEKSVRAIVMRRLDHIRLGNFGDAKRIQNGNGIGSCASIMVRGTASILVKKE